jgi:hypothetical protein
MNYFGKEPIFDCPICKTALHTDWVDNGFGPYAIQASPYHCEDCNWIETSCPQEVCIEARCISWETCQGRAINVDALEKLGPPPEWS